MRFPHLRLALAGLLVLLAIAACRPAGPALAPTVPPATETAVPATAAATITPTATKTPAVVPPETQAQPTEATEADLIAAVLASGELALLQSLPSPDGLWLAEVVRVECTPVLPEQELAYEVLRLTGPDGTVHDVRGQLQYCGGLGAFGLNLLIWSDDSRNFYFDQARVGAPDGLVCGNWSRGTTRIDVATLESEPLPGDGPLLPDGSGFLIWGGPDWVVWDLAAGEVARSSSVENDKPVISMSLSEDGSRVVYVQRSDCLSPDEDSTVILLDLATMAHTELLEAEAPGFIAASWETDDTILLLDPAGTEYRFTISTGVLTPPG